MPRLTDVVADHVAFLALSLDGKIWAGHWEVIGQAAVPEHLPLPAYKEAVGSPDRIDVVDNSGQRRRRASSAEAAALPNRKVVAPVRLEKALRALHGVEPWQGIFDELRPVESATTAQLFG